MAGLIGPAQSGTQVQRFSRPEAEWQRGGRAGGDRVPLPAHRAPLSSYQPRSWGRLPDRRAYSAASIGEVIKGALVDFYA